MTSIDPDLDLPRLRDWIGRTETASDIVTPRLEASLRAVLDRPSGLPAEGDVACPTVHWCLTPAIVPMAGIGEDGHPRRGGFLPPVPLPRRMWAGGELHVHDGLRVGDVVTRQSTIEDVAAKTGRTGTLCFVTVRHVLSTTRGLAIEERQDIVYRAMTRAAPAEPKNPPAQPAATWERASSSDAVMLFRYSALTFNGHRIHYDRAYATGVEGYPGLVVHGPLQATALFDLAVEARGVSPRRFSFRGVHPLFDGTPFTAKAVADGEGLTLWIADESGRTTMQATAQW